MYCKRLSAAWIVTALLLTQVLAEESEPTEKNGTRTDRSAAAVKLESRQGQFPGYLGPPLQGPQQPVPVYPGPPGNVAPALPLPPAARPPLPPQEGGDPNWPVTRPEVSLIKNINVLCEKNRMRVTVEFDRPFYGMVFSKGHYSDERCVHLPPNSGRTAASFEISMDACGMSSGGQQVGAYSDTPGLFIENTIIIQYDPLLQEVWDQARKLRCTWYDYYEKSVTFRPFNVDMLQAVTANFLGDNLQCWMQIQVGKGPWASEVSGIVKIGQTMTMVLAIKDDENKFDMLVRNCIAHDGKRPPIQLVDEYGCVMRPKIMSRFQKIKNFGASASVVSYAYFQAFKFPDSMNVHFQCVIQVCRQQCPEPRCPGDVPALGAGIGQPGGYLDPRIPEDKSGMDSSKLIRKSDTVVGGAIKREGALPDNSVQVVAFGGQPRSLNHTLPTVEGVNNVQRRRRRSDDGTVEEEVDVRTTRIIQVVAPDDVAFNLSVGSDPEVVSRSAAFDLESGSVCISSSGFVAAVVTLLLVLIVVCIVCGFLLMRLRMLTRKKGSSTSYDNTEYVKSSLDL